MTQIYWAADNDKRLISYVRGQTMRTAEASGGFSTLYDVVVKSGLRNLASYYSPMAQSSDTYTSLGYGGDKGEVVMMKVPLARTYIRQFVSLVTKDRLSVEALVDVTDKNPQETAKIGKALANHIIEKCKLDSLRTYATEKSAVTGNAFYSIVWDPNAGEDVDVDENGMIVKSGANVVTIHPLWEVTFDFNVEPQKLRWVCLAIEKNRWDLAATYQGDEAKVKSIMGAPNVNESLIYAQANLWRNTQMQSDFIYEYHFYHLPTPALPMGRHVAFTGDVALIDEQYTETQLPFAPLIIEPVQDTGLGYPMYSSLAPTQEIIDATLSTIASNQLNLAGNIILLPEGNKITPTQISKGLKALPYKPLNIPGNGKPEVLNLSSVNPQFFEFANTCVGLLDQVSMINSTLRGQPPSNVTSGQMAATLISSSMEFLSSASQANSVAIEKILTLGIKNYQKYGTEENLVEIVGRDNTVRVKNFKREDISKISRIKLREQSAVMQTTAGRMAMGDALLSKGQADARQYSKLIEGAPVEEVYKDNYDAEMAVKNELEAFLQGETIAPHILQNHPDFIREYKRLLDNTPTALRNQVTPQILQLIQEHLTLEEQLQMQPLLFSIIRGQMSPMSQQPGQGPDPAQIMQSESPVAQPSNPAEPLPVEGV
jgi:hypothetical protein